MFFHYHHRLVNSTQKITLIYGLFQKEEDILITYFLIYLLILNTESAVHPVGFNQESISMSNMV